MKHSVKLFTLLFFFCINYLYVSAQQKHFMYVQSQDKQPFAVVLNGKVYSSSDYGYVIVPKLTDGDYNFTVSFPMNKFPDQAFSCSINKKDIGYILKNNSERWTLENLQTQKDVTNSSSEVAQKSDFGNMLSEVVSDSNLTKNNVAAQPQADTTTTSATVIDTAEKSAALAANNAEFTEDSIRPEKISESKLDTGTKMLFVDKTQNSADTINVFIPADTVASNENNTAIFADTIKSQNQNLVTQNDNPTSEKTEAAFDTTTHNASNPFYKPEQNKTAENSNSAQINQTQTLNVSNGVRLDCANMISDEDLNKLKRKMFTQKNNNDMIQYAVKYINKKCITTEQIKSIGDLFSSDDGRYNLYDAMYNYVYDYANYSSLSSQILDPYYKKRFAAMLR